MAQAVLRLLRDTSLSARLRAAGLDHVRRFDWGSVRPQLLATYASATKRAFNVRAGVA